MSHISPAAILVWAVMSVLLMGFLLFHLYSFDRFKCLKWNNGPYSGAFKRIMTYSYLGSIPLIMAFALGFAVIKYDEGFILHPQHGVIAKPHQRWTKAHHDAIFPLHLLFSVGWSLEMVTHLEELCFWLFLVNSGSAQQDWFKSLYFRTWVSGSVVAVIYMPLVTIFTRSDPLRSEAYTFLAGSLGSLSITLWFLPVLWTFPSFLDSLRREGVDVTTIVRLTKFHELNTIRIVFRFLMVLPLVILGADGTHAHSHVNESMLGTDFLAIVSAFGCAVSSGITLVIFFPRSIEGEMTSKEAARQRKKTKSLGLNTSMLENRRVSTYGGGGDEYADEYDDEDADSVNIAPSQSYLLSSTGGGGGGGKRRLSSPYSKSQNDNYWDAHTQHTHTDTSELAPLPQRILPAIRPNRRNIHSEVELGGIDGLTEGNLSKHTLGGLRKMNVNPVLHNFRSPLDVGNFHGGGDDEEGGLRREESRFSFTKR